MTESTDQTYWVLKEAKLDDSAVIDATPPGSPADWRFMEGESLSEEFPSAATVRFAKAYADGVRLYDVLSTDLDVWFVSERFRSTLEGLAISNVEFLPVMVLDHKGKEASAGYSIMNILGSEAAIDMETSKYRISAVSGDQIKRIKKLSLDLEAIDPEAKIFRATTMRRLILIRDDVREALEASDLTGYKIYNAEGWNGSDIV